MGGKYWRARACDRVFLSDSKSQGVDNGSKKKNDSAKRNESAVSYHDSFRATIPTCSMAIFGKLVSLLSLTP